MPPSDLDSYGDLHEYGEISIHAGFGDFISGVGNAIWDGITFVPRKVGEAAVGVGSQIIEGIAKDAVAAAAEFSLKPVTWWITKGVLVNPEDNPAVFGTIRADLAPLISMILLGSILWQAGKMIIQRRREPGISIFTGLLRFLIVTSVYTVVISQLLRAGELFSKSLFQDAIAQFARADWNVLGGLGILLLCVFSILLFLVSIVQWFLIFFREAGLVVLVALLPIAAAGSITDGTRPWLTRMIPWMLALILYKPMAAIIYYLGFSLLSNAGSAGQNTDGIAFVIIGMVVILCACLALPVMMKFFAFTGVATGGAAAGAATASLLSSAGSKLTGGGATGAAGSGGGSGGPQPAMDFMNSMGPGTGSGGGPSPTGSGGGGGGGGGGSSPGMSMAGGGGGGKGSGSGSGSGGGSGDSGGGGGSGSGSGSGSGGGGSGGGAKGGSGGGGGGGGQPPGATPVSAGSGGGGASGAGTSGAGASGAGASGASTAAAGGGASGAAAAAGPAGAVVVGAQMAKQKIDKAAQMPAEITSKATGAAANLGGAMTENIQ